MQTKTDIQSTATVQAVSSGALLGFFAVYAGRDKARGHTCIVRARDKAHALRGARSNGIVLARSAYAVPLTVQAYAAILRGCGITVSGVPEQMELMQCA
jgi:hypothetical protein